MRACQDRSWSLTEILVKLLFFSGAGVELRFVTMPSVDGDENGEEEVERSANEDENMSEDEDDEESSLTSDDSSSESSSSYTFSFFSFAILPTRFLRHYSKSAWFS